MVRAGNRLSDRLKLAGQQGASTPCRPNHSNLFRRYAMATPHGSKHPLYKHGHKARAGGSGTYNSWRSIIGRCCNPNQRSYKMYGAKGVTVCARWRESFVNFLEDMGPRPEGTSIDRIDNSLGYEPSNCRWSTRVEQSRNRSFARKISYAGKSQCLAEWADEYQIKYGLLKRRLSAGWEMESALTTPNLKSDRPITFDGETLLISQWARKLSVHPRTLFNRIHRGWPIARALTEPVHIKRRQP
jgi:hypothetical protein